MKRFVYAIGTILLFLTGCNLDQLETDDISNPAYQALLAVPLGETSFTLRELIEQTGDSTVTIEEDSTSTLLTLTYVDNFTYTSDTDILSTNDITQSGSIDLLTTQGVPTATNVPFNQTFNFSFPASGDDGQLDSVFFETGTLEFILNNPLASPISYNATIDNIIAPSGQAVAISGSAANGSDTRSEDLSGYKMILTEAASGNTTFQLILTGTVSLNAGESIPAGSQLSFSISFLNQTFDIVYGDFGDKSVTLGNNEGVEVDFFSSLFGEDAIEFENPEMIMTFRNSIGIPMGVDLSGISGQKIDENGNITNETQLGGLVTNGPQVIGYPSTDQVGETIETVLTINRNNSTLPDLIAAAPNFLSFNLTALTNPTNILEQNFFDPDFTTIEADIEFRLPMVMAIRELAYETSYNIDIDQVKFREDSDQDQEVDSIAIRVVSSNLLPINVSLDFQILDAAENVIYEVPEVQTIQSANLGVDPLVGLELVSFVPRITTSDIPLGLDGIIALEDGERINLVLNISTPSTTNSTRIYPPFLARYSLDISLSVLAKVNLEFE